VEEVCDRRFCETNPAGVSNGDQQTAIPSRDGLPHDCFSQIELDIFLLRANSSWRTWNGTKLLRSLMVTDSSRTVCLQELCARVACLDFLLVLYRQNRSFCYLYFRCRKTCSQLVKL